ncbi:flagellar protein FliT [Gilvimarinus algae]|uniref:Flagellar protein FliT n=1 Tax=Gilvimarinus algae TaxID=3058037 RepID=A0ABT8TET9_9GAMM|nr:flagellar protein FliT [Gilvimarinus sp. SDUM040014]MDO3382607.1 flagellar protein FliT [Gilvimarinus sp. SDUM040014]
MNTWQQVLRQAWEYQESLSQRVDAGDWPGFSEVLASRDQCLGGLAELPVETLPEAEQRELAEQLNTLKDANLALLERVESEQAGLQREHRGARLAQKAAKAYKVGARKKD